MLNLDLNLNIEFFAVPYLKIVLNSHYLSNELSIEIDVLDIHLKKKLTSKNTEKSSNLMKESNFSKWISCSFWGKEKKAASKDSIITSKDSTLHWQRVRHCNFKENGCWFNFLCIEKQWKNGEDFTEESGERTKAWVRIQGETEFFKIHQKKYFRRVNKTSSFGRNLHKWLSFRYKLSWYRWFCDLDERMVHQIFLVDL